MSAFRPSKRFVKFALVGVMNSAFSYAVFALLIWIGVHYTLATLVSLILGTLFNFKTTGGIVFGSHDNGKIVLFVVVYAIGYLTNIGLQRVLHIAGVDQYVSGLIGAIPAMLIVYVLCSRVVFTTPLGVHSEDCVNSKGSEPNHVRG